MDSSARPDVSLFYYQIKRTRCCKAFLSFSDFFLHFIQVEQVELELSNNIVWHFPQHICCIHRIFPKYSNYPNVNNANSNLRCDHLDIWILKKDPITNFTNSCSDWSDRSQKFWKHLSTLEHPGGLHHPIMNQVSPEFLVKFQCFSWLNSSPPSMSIEVQSEKKQVSMVHSNVHILAIHKIINERNQWNRILCLHNQADNHLEKSSTFSFSTS